MSWKDGEEQEREAGQDPRRATRSFGFWYKTPRPDLIIRMTRTTESPLCLNDEAVVTETCDWMLPRTMVLGGQWRGGAYQHSSGPLLSFISVDWAVTLFLLV